METSRNFITVETTIQAPVNAVWNYWTDPQHITRWNQASDDWHTPFAENDVRTGGKFNIRMEARDGSTGFDFSGSYDQVRENECIEYTMGDGRKVTISFSTSGNQTRIIETFEAESENSMEMQRFGWQAILDSFRKYAEAEHQKSQTGAPV